MSQDDVKLEEVELTAPKRDLRPPRVVYQDGGLFYEDTAAARHGVLWTAPYKVKAGDAEAAEDARADFIAWAAGQPFRPVF